MQSQLCPALIRLDRDLTLKQDELDRMDLEHHIFLLLLEGKLHLAPLSDPQRILDIGTGTGIWAIDMADKYPSASVLGTDLSPVQPSL
jgi:cyclopropane fatty-acyl-phospholipid synthase-like methyltransferase